MTIKIDSIEETGKHNIVKVLAGIKRVLRERDEYIVLAVELYREKEPDLCSDGIYQEVAKRVGVSTATVRRALLMRQLNKKG